jgi:FtsZ-binding cell division protein ZapB
MEQALLTTPSHALDALGRLEARIRETVEEIRLLRQQKAEVERRNRELEAEVETLRAERRDILERVEKLLAQIDTLA